MLEVLGEFGVGQKYQPTQVLKGNEGKLGAIGLNWRPGVSALRFIWQFPPRIYLFSCTHLLFRVLCPRHDSLIFHEAYVYSNVSCILNSARQTREENIFPTKPTTTRKEEEEEQNSINLFKTIKLIKSKTNYSFVTEKEREKGGEREKIEENLFV